MSETAEPFGEYLSEELGIPVTTEVLTDYTGLIEGMRNQHVDIAFLPPFAYVQAEERADVEVLLKAISDGSDSYVAQYTVSSDSQIEDIDDLIETEDLVWASARLTLQHRANLFPAQQMMEVGVEDLDDHFTRCSMSVHTIRRDLPATLLDGQADFATTFEDARVRLEEEVPDIYDEVRVDRHDSTRSPMQPCL
ncbi:MAG: PhnD/SsuA/transferrin family substrate-binding protein [Alkalibacterium sp.]|nr:PhnD/SsuA/transferrin family substrate-binding protein [Alkalibacterium sp.]